uniref:Small integral membrane protein 15 n=1 Tax=Panagrellus redivivus TaxID=6233 RepID=A0A7E4W5G5_PANRE
MASHLWKLAFIGFLALTEARKLPDRFIGFEDEDPTEVNNDGKSISAAIDEMSYRYPKQFQSLLIILSSVFLILYWIISFFTILTMFLVCYPKNFKDINIKAKEYTETKTRNNPSPGKSTNNSTKSVKSKKSIKESSKSKRSPAK